MAETPPFGNIQHAGSIILVKADLGIKRACPSCGIRFYDLQKRPIDCPKCHFTFEPESLYKQRRPRQPEALKGVVGNLDQNEERDEEESEEDSEEEVVVDEAPLLIPSDDDDEEEVETAVEDEAEGAGMSVVDGDVDVEEIEDVEDGADEGLLEEVEDDEGTDVSGIIEPGGRKDEV